jgi:hypothetical protein
MFPEIEHTVHLKWVRNGSYLEPSYVEGCVGCRAEGMMIAFANWLDGIDASVKAEFISSFRHYSPRLDRAWNK